MPVVTETFALLPCSKATTTGLEGCAEHRILTLDQRINVLRHQVFTRLFDDAAKRRFIRAEVSWSKFRRSTCLSDSDVNEGGSLAPVDFANCAVRLDQQHVADLTALLASYASH
jgi:uncharacterized protein YecT (DUF1311 family)